MNTLFLLHLLKYTAGFWFWTVITYIVWTCIINAPRYISHTDPWWWNQKYGTFSVSNAIRIVDNGFQFTIVAGAIFIAIVLITSISLTLLYPL